VRALSLDLLPSSTPSLSLSPVLCLSVSYLLACARFSSYYIFRLSEVLIQYDLWDNFQDLQSNGVSLSLFLSFSLSFCSHLRMRTCALFPLALALLLALCHSLTLSLSSSQALSLALSLILSFFPLSALSLSRAWARSSSLLRALSLSLYLSSSVSLSLHTPPPILHLLPFYLCLSHLKMCVLSFFRSSNCDFKSYIMNVEGCCSHYNFSLQIIHSVTPPTQPLTFYPPI